jgi:hypothetical protein
MSEQAANEKITEEVTSWPGVEAAPGRRGELAFRVGGREIGHLHGDHAACGCRKSGSGRTNQEISGAVGAETSA